jgi:dihydrofolate synthase/folylpolyglutamate synthase
VLVVGMSGERDPIEMLEALGAGSARLVVATEAATPRAMAAGAVAAAARSLGPPVELVPDVVGAVERALALATPDDVVLVTGSLYVVGTARAALTRRP